jgi:hypothetical protein
MGQVPAVQPAQLGPEGCEVVAHRPDLFSQVVSLKDIIQGRWVGEGMRVTYW